MDPKHMFKYTREAMQFAESCVKEEAPFLIYLSHHAVHNPIQSRPATLAACKSWPVGERHRGVKYAAMLSDTDASLGMFMAKLEELGIDDNTCVVFLSDNGGTPRATQAPLRGFKGMLYEGGIRVPFVVRWPGRFAPAVLDTPVMAIDLYPTLLELAGVPAPADYELDGRSLVPLLNGAAETWEERAMFWHFPAYLDKRGRPSTVVMKGDWKLFLWLEPWVLDGGRDAIDTNGAVELYNLKDDIGEKRNAALTHKDVRDALLDELLAWQQRVEAPIPLARRVKGKK
jgi:arylsulfatase A-like enzyme